MQRKSTIISIGICLSTLCVADVALAQPSPKVCDSSLGGPEICVRFDNRPDPPEYDADFSFVLGDSPQVWLWFGSDASEARHWRIWCKSGGSPANIGLIKSIYDWNYEVKILDPAGNAGAADLGRVSLSTGQDSYSTIMDGAITGDLKGTLAVQKSSGGRAEAPP